MNNKDRDFLDTIAIEIHFLKMAINANDPRQELVFRCVDIRKKIMDYLDKTTGKE